MCVSTVNNKIQQEATVAKDSVLAFAEVRHRPIFYKELGEFFKGLRRARGWQQKQASDIARRRGLTPLTRQVLLRLEKGQTKNPEPNVLHALADLYEITYDDLVSRFVTHRYGRGAAALSDGVGSAPGGADVTPSARVLELEQERDRLFVAIEKITDVAGELVKVAAAAREGRTVMSKPARGGRSHRKAG